jgi:hypothetical protein
MAALVVAARRRRWFDFLQTVLFGQLGGDLEAALVLAAKLDILLDMIELVDERRVVFGGQHHVGHGE